MNLVELEKITNALHTDGTPVGAITTATVLVNPAHVVSVTKRRADIARLALTNGQSINVSGHFERTVEAINAQMA